MDTTKKAKIGVGIITCNRPQFVKPLFLQIFNAMSSKEVCINELVVVNDGDPLDAPIMDGFVIQNEENLGVGKTKNKALKHLMDAGCDHLFLIEDDITIKDLSVFSKYIQAGRDSGIQHLNYGPGSPFNRKQCVQFDLHNREDLNNESPPNPKLVIDYRESKIALYEHSVGMFSYFTRGVIEAVGYIDEQFHNAWEHVEHTYRIIREGYHPPFWYFADVSDSDLYLGSHRDALKESTMSKNQDEWFKNVHRGRELYRIKHSCYPNTTPIASKEEVINSLREIKTKWKI